MLRVAYANGKLQRLPVIEKPEEAPSRAGFFEPEQFQAVRRRLRLDLQVAATIGYTYGWRKGEVLGLERRHVDLDAGTLRLDPGSTKNGEGRVVYLTPEVARLLTARLARVDALQRALGRIIPFVSPPRGAAPGPTDYRLPEGVGDRLQARGCPGPPRARPPAHGGEEHGAQWGGAVRGHEDDRTQDGERLPTVRDRGRRRPAGGRP